ncbi:MAG: 3'-5' exonuclease, partial [Pseudomonadota bacterium]
MLDVVDRLFVEQGGMQAMFDVEARPEPSDQIRHDAARTDPGLVELWPLAPKAEQLEEKDPWDTTPVDAKGAGDPRVLLAQTIAKTISDWIETKEPVYDRDLKRHRPLHAGDILILVQKRVGGLFDALIKALKTQGLPVAGADRLVLQDALIVRDLLSLTRFVLLPQDDLSLAEVLKSPLFGLNDQALFDLCVDRKGTLWDAVQSRDSSVAEALSEMIETADRSPYDFYARLLDQRGPHGLTYRAALFRRLGLESREALDAFLSVALSHQQRLAPSLQGFLQTFTADAIEIKRDKDPAGREVRVMTVHGAKGLEAPIVFLPDTTRAPRAGVSGLIRAGNSWILAPSSRDSIPLVDRYKAEEEAQATREYMRLLYVAMTRAESRLVLCGYHHGNSQTGYQDGSWYDWLKRTMVDMPGAEVCTAPFAGDDIGGMRYGQHAPRNDMASVTEASPDIPLPDWIDKSACAVPARVQSASPSSLLNRDEPVGHGPGGGRFVRGIVIHKLLEILPDHPVSRRRELARKMVDDYPDITDAEGDAIIAEVFGVIDNPDFADVFAEGSRAEVGLAGRVETIRDGSVFLTAQVDRLRVTPDTIYLVDYKSNRPPPERLEDVHETYVAQMAGYRELARAIWPDRIVRCGLVWTDAARMMWLHDNAMDAALTTVNT